MLAGGHEPAAADVERLCDQARELLRANQAAGPISAPASSA